MPPTHTPPFSQGWLLQVTSGETRNAQPLSATSDPSAVSARI
jgi:hypothetical protein